MKFGAIFILALGLAMDAMAVAAARGLAASQIRLRHVVLVATFFGGFQAIMPFIGWMAGSRLGPFVAAWDHWIAFVLLVAIGGKMLAEGRSTKKEDSRSDDELFRPTVLFVLAVATSIDALAAGLTLPMLDAPLGLSLATIGATTAVLSAVGLFAGRRFGASLGRRLDFAGGVVLIGLGIKILVQHLRGA
jgi:putative Mn2+ efflux pump MntP